MTRLVAILSVSALALLGPLTVPALAAETLHTHLNGYQETLLTISTGAAGDFRAKISADESSVAYELSYDGLEGNVQQAHIHFGAAWQSGGISVFLCTNLGNSPGTQPCPQSGTITGVFTAANVIGPAAQGIEAGALAELIAAIRAGVAYVNVHSTKWPSGEIRGQFK
jgi:CHRD domain